MNRILINQPGTDHVFPERVFTPTPDIARGEIAKQYRRVSVGTQNELLIRDLKELQQVFDVG